MIHDHGDDENRQQWVESINCKKKFYSFFKVYIVVYWTIGLIIVSLRPLFLLYHEWIFALVYQSYLVANTTLLFIMLNSSNYKLYRDLSEEDIPLARDLEEQGDRVNIPLPFNKNKNPRIVGDVIFIQSASKNKKSGILAIGVESF
jgi:hypothetical protein